MTDKEFKPFKLFKTFKPFRRKIMGFSALQGLSSLTFFPHVTVIPMDVEISRWAK